MHDNSLLLYIITILNFMFKMFWIYLPELVAVFVLESKSHSFGLLTNDLWCVSTARTQHSTHAIPHARNTARTQSLLLNSNKLLLFYYLLCLSKPILCHSLRICCRPFSISTSCYSFAKDGKNKEGVSILLSTPACPVFWRHTRNMKETPEEPSVY